MLSIPGLASAAVSSGSFVSSQKLLEQELASRAAWLGRLGADITNSSSLTKAHASKLEASSSDTVEVLDTLVAKVPTDTTEAQLKSDAASMAQLNRQFAVLTPKVFVTIEADATFAQVVTDLGDERPLQNLVDAFEGQPGSAIARSDVAAFIKAVNQANEDARVVAPLVISQTPADFPKDGHVFVHADQELSNAQIALNQASADEHLVGLALGNYNGQ